jgi:hypothetical protein
MKKYLMLAALLAITATQAASDVSDEAGSEFVFARAQFSMSPRWILDYREAPWHHDYPFSEDLFLTMVKEVTGMHTTRKSYAVVRLDSPEIFKYPWVYISEPGYLSPTSKEISNLQEYVRRGGFLVCDDFRGRDLDVLRLVMRDVLPGREMFRMDVSHPLFHSFYDIASIVMDPPYYDARFLGGRPEFWGLTDEDGRLVLIANHNNDLGEFMEGVDHGEKPLKFAALSVKLMVNYLVYAMMH